MDTPDTALRGQNTTSGGRDCTQSDGAIGRTLLWSERRNSQRRMHNRMGIPLDRNPDRDAVSQTGEFEGSGEPIMMLR